MSTHLIFCLVKWEEGVWGKSRWNKEYKGSPQQGTKRESPTYLGKK